MKTKEQILNQIEKLQEQLKKVEETEKQQMLAIIKLSTGTILVEKNLHKEMNTPSKIVIPKGYRLLKLHEFIEIYNNHFDKLDWSEKPDEFVEQPIEKNKSKYPCRNVWFGSVGDGSGLYGSDRGLGYDDIKAFGVRFCKDLEEKQQNKR